MASGSPSSGVQDLVQHCGIEEACLNAEVTPECFHDISRYLSQWKLLALKLKLSSADIEDIERDNKKAEEQRVSFLGKWKQKRSYKATYKALVESLLSIQRVDDARGVCRVLPVSSGVTVTTDVTTIAAVSSATSSSTSLVSANTPPSLTNPPVSSHQTLPTMSSTMLNRAESPDTPCSTGLEDRIAKLKEDFEELVDLIEESFIKNGVLLTNIQRSIKHIPVSLKRDLGDYFYNKTEQILGAKSMKSLFVFLSCYWDYLNTGLLEFLVKKFGLDIDKQLLGTYLTKLEQFRHSVKLGEYVQSEHSFVDVSACRYQEIITIMGPGWEEKTLQDAENFKNELAKRCLIQPFLTRIHANRSSIALVFYLPPLFEVKIEELELFFKAMNVVKVHLDSVCFFDWSSGDKKEHTQSSTQEMATSDKRWKKSAPRAKRLAKLPHHRQHHSDLKSHSTSSEDKEKPLRKHYVSSHGTWELDPVRPLDDQPSSTQSSEQCEIQPELTTSQPGKHRVSARCDSEEKNRGDSVLGEQRAERKFYHLSSQHKKPIPAEDSSQEFNKNSSQEFYHMKSDPAPSLPSQAAIHSQEWYGGSGVDQWKKPGLGDHQDPSAQDVTGANNSTGSHSFQGESRSARYAEVDTQTDSHSSNKTGKPKGTHKGQHRDRDKSWFNNVRSFSFQDIMSLREMPAGELVSNLSSKIKKFQCTLQYQLMLEKPGVMDAIIIILSKISSTLASHNEKASQILAEVLSERCATFQLRLKIYVSQSLLDSSKSTSRYSHTGNLTVKQKVETLSGLFTELLTALPGSSWSCLPIDEFYSSVERLAEKGDIENTLLCALQDILMLRDAAREQHSKRSRQKRSEGGGWDNSEYREVQILPKSDEVCISKKPERLRKNIISGSYSDWLHYYDVQFRLLREDFIAPLRNGVCDYLSGVRGKELKNVRVYQNVLIIEPAFAHTGLCYKIKLDFSHMHHQSNWEHSKRLLHGSLLCLSPEYDNFVEEIYFATITDRDVKKLENGELEVMFQDNAKILSFSSTDTRFTLVESCAYFEASRHILHSLQTAEVDTMPFTAHLIAGDYDSVNQPQYLRESIGTPYNLSFLLTDEEKSLRVNGDDDSLTDISSDRDPFIGGAGHRPTSLGDCFLVDQIVNFNRWPSSDQTELDHSQMKALQMGLTQEIAVIQGPPGTGKTYIGLKVVEGLLLNKKIWRTDGARSPILVMCFTNHALDQFLEGILNGPLYKDSEVDDIKVVRIGGRSKSERLAEFNLHHKKRNVFLPRDVVEARHTAAELVADASLKSKELTEKYYMTMRSCQHVLLKDLDDIVSPFHHSQLFYYSRSEEEQFLALEIWLGFYYVNNPYIKEAYDRMVQEEQQVEETSGAQDHDSTTIMAESREEQQVEEENDSDSLIDVTGEAAVEQSDRILDEAYHHPRREVNFAGESGDLESYIFSLKIHHNSFSPIYFADIQFQQRYIPFSEKWARIVLELGFEVDPMSAEEAAEIQNIWALSFEDRWRLYHYWYLQYLEKLCDECEAEFLTYNQLCSKSEEARKAADRYALETAEIIGMTTTGAAKYQHILHQVKPRIVIVEEAAEVLESHIVSALNAGTQHLILIGDHKQLRPKPNEYELAKKYNLDVSLFERLVRNGFPHATLEYQHRMRPEIAELVKPHIYTTLSNHEAVLSYPDVRGVSTNLFFINHCQEEREDDNHTSHSNAHEASYLVSLCRYLLQQRYTPQQITILVTYAGQLLAMRNLMPRNEFEGVRVSTVDNFQGEENDIILLSLVRSNSDNNVGFLKEENRVCVALSRARQGLYCIGNFTMLRSQVPLWDTIMSDMESKGKLGDGLVLYCSNHPETSFTAKASQDFEKKAPKGGCLKDCSGRLRCGHVCEQKCHYSDPEHGKYRCWKSCPKSCPEGHPCRKFCYEACKCTVQVTRSMPGCDHDQKMLCFEDPSKVSCTNPCKQSCPKGHPCPLLCHQECKPCTKIVSATMPLCKHEQKLRCHEDPMQVKCRADCPKRCENGHLCAKRCYEDCGDCMVPVTKFIPECDHQITLPCCIKPEHKECTEPCERTLPCGHKCALRCGQECLSEKCTKYVTVKLPECGHEVKVKCHVSQNVSQISCSKNCERTLKCGHPCINKCSEPCVEECKVQVNKTWPCGHKKKRPCYQTSDPDKYPCDSNCNKQLKCGHPCTKKCSQPCDEKCKQKIKKTYPCGHENETSCSSTPSDTPCKSLCTYILACGHRCSGKCSECYGRHMHKPCGYKIDVRRFCGHSLQLPCIGLADSHPGRKNLSLSCPHTSVNKTCPEDISLTCDEPCQWNCSHYECELACSEMCTRPRCDERCQLKLKCGHQCFGLCGEPCLSFCPECQLKKFRQKLKSQGEFTKDSQYYQLVCGHIFSVKYLDEYVDKMCKPKSTESMPIHPLLCPVKECKSFFMCGYRYGNQAKLLLTYVQDVNTIVQYSPDRYVPADDVGSVLLKGRLENALSPVIFQYTENYPHTKSTRGDVIQKRGRTNVHVCYQPMPEISATLYRLKSHHPRSKEDKYLVFLLIEALNLLQKLWSPGTEDDTLKDVKKYARFICNSLLKDEPYRLSYQTLMDIRSALFRVHLGQGIKLARDTFEHDDDECLVKAETFLKSQDSHITKADFKLHMDAIGIDCKELLTDLDAYWPDVYKGQWWRCAEGHYYCSPPSLLDGIELKCPHCNGFENSIKVPDQEEIQKRLLAAAPSLEPVTTQSTKQSTKAPTLSKSEAFYPQAQGNASDVEMLPPHIPAMMTYRLPPGPVPQPMFQMGPQPRANYYPPDPLQPQPGTPPMPLGPGMFPPLPVGQQRGSGRPGGQGRRGRGRGRGRVGGGGKGNGGRRN